MTIAAVTNVHHTYGGGPILDGATLSIADDERIGLVGRNGCGKSTLLRMLAGMLTPDSGAVQVTRGVRVGYLAQHPALDPTRTLREEAATAFASLAAMHEELDATFAAMASAESDELERLLNRQATLEVQIQHAGGYAVDHRIDATLHGLGFVDAEFGTAVTSLSGGQRARLSLAKLLLEEPDLLLLDEPTNHLDIDGRRWLEQFLAEEFRGAVVIVSHDRWLLDRVVTRIIEIDRGAIREYPGNYHDFVRLRRERQLSDARVHEKQLDRIRAEEGFIRRYKAGQRAKQARGRQTRLDRFKEDELVSRPAELESMRLILPEPPRVGDVVVAGESLTKGFGDRRLFDHFSIDIKPGDRIGILGPNGAGKTTLVRTLLGDLEPDRGSVRRSPRLAVGWFRQTQDHLDLSLTVWEYLQSVIIGLGGGAESAVRASEQQARDLAGAFLFTGPEQDKRLSVLSGGERARVVLAGLVASAKNLLVLDEPTNHLDIPSAERLEQALLAYGGADAAGGCGGALLLISHDRALLDAVCGRLVILDGVGGIRLFEGGYSEYLERSPPTPPERADGERGASSRATRRGARESNGTPKKPAASPLAKLSLEELERRIEAAESRIRAIDSALMDPKVYSDPAEARRRGEERQRLTDELVPLEFEWSRRADLA